MSAKFLFFDQWPTNWLLHHDDISNSAVKLPGNYPLSNDKCGFMSTYLAETAKQRVCNYGLVTEDLCVIWYFYISALHNKYKSVILVKFHLRHIRKVIYKKNCNFWLVAISTIISVVSELVAESINNCHCHCYTVAKYELISMMSCPQLSQLKTNKRPDSYSQNKCIFPYICVSFKHVWEMKSI